MNKPWSSLLNAHHIDWVIASLKDNPELWDTAWGAVRPATSYEGSHAAYNSAYDAARYAAGHAAYDAGRLTAYLEAGKAIHYVAAVDAILALIAYDDCDQYLSMSYEELPIWAALSEHPAATLLVPMVYVKERLKL